ncbi:YtxH domain-containing protein [Paenibacillus brevis]|uniref:YtxH domain-containing protein n=1 Tax=Paenibacillus brevis TaxID=2841508 RepID=A0ABS6FPW1_9BACL|nr:YtxH domain-containing protein [Paenibacillus brevis]
MSDGKKGWIWGAAIGTIVGSVTALLFAPKAGRELRKDLAEGARQVGEKTQEVAGKVGEQSTQIAGAVKEKAEDLVHEFQTWRASKAASSEEVQEAAQEEPLALEVAVEPSEEADEAAQTEETVSGQTEEAGTEAEAAAVEEETDKE